MTQTTPGIAEVIRASIDRSDRQSHEHIAKLRAEEPAHALGFFDQMEERWQVVHRLDGLRMGLHGLMGYYERDGQVPIDEIRALLDEVSDHVGPSTHRDGH